RRPRRVELLVHEMRREGDDVNLAPVAEQTPRGLQAEEATPDDRGALRLRGLGAGGVAVLERAGSDPARAQAAALPLYVGDRRDEGAAAGGDDELVVGLKNAARAEDALGDAIDVDCLHARVQAHLVLLVPSEAIEKDLARILHSVDDVREE